MQLIEMRTLYNLYHHKRVLHLIKTNFFSNPKISTQIGCLPPKYHSLGCRCIHSSNRLRSNVEDENPRVWTTFDPVSNDVTTRAVGEGESSKCESDSGDEKVATLSGLGSFVEGTAPERGGIEGGGVTAQSWSTVYACGEVDSSVEGLVPERDGGGDAKEAVEERSEPVRKSWASVYPKRNGWAGRRAESSTSAVDGSGSLRSELDSGDDKFEALAGPGSYPESSVQERGSDTDEKFEEDRSGMTPKSWSSVYRKESGGISSGAKATTRTVNENTSLRYASDIGNEKFGILSEGLVPDSGAGAGKKTSDEELSGGRGGDKASLKSWSSVKRHRSPMSAKDKSVDHLSTGMVASKKKKGKTKTSWVCSSCGETFGQWWGSCRFCGGELKQFFEAENVDTKTTGFNITDKVVGSWFLQKPGELVPQRLSDVNKGINQLTWRIPLSGLFGAEVGRVLGGGLVPGSLVLVGGDPGVGKSTLLLQIAAMIAEGHGSGQPAPVVYVSGEESVEQIANRADRMRVGTDDLFLYSGTDIEDILEKIHVLSPRALIVDSIQTVYLKGVAGSAGGIVQVKECTQSLLRFAKKTNIPVLLIGHVTKTGDLAGPRVLEHIVDVVLYMEGEKYSTHRFLRSVKNRFGSTDELGVFEMSQGGLQAVLNPSDIFLSEQHSDSEILVGLAIAVIIDGSRSFLLEIQALCLADASVPRQFNGVQQSRAQMIISVLIKQAGLMLQNNAIFVNVVSGVKLQETAGDLAIAAAICSSFLEFPIPNDIAFIGEIGLGGELRPVPRMEKRVNAVAKLGYRKCIVPKSTEKQLTTLDSSGMVILGCKNLKEVINIVFRN